VEVPEGAVKAGSNLHGYYVQVSGEKIRCDSPEEAMYIQYAAGNELFEFIPKSIHAKKRNVF